MPLLGASHDFAHPVEGDTAWSESYFDPAEMHQESERFGVLVGVLRERWGAGVAQLVDQAWHSDTLGDCATFGEWLLGLPEAVPLPAAPPAAEGDATGQAKIHALNVGPDPATARSAPRRS